MKPEDVVRQPEQLAERHAVAHRHGEKAHERGVGIGDGGVHIALHCLPTHGVRPVEHHHPHAAPGGLAHQLCRGRGVGVIPGADVLEVHERDVGAVECGEVGRARPTIETIDW